MYKELIICTIIAVLIIMGDIFSQKYLNKAVDNLTEQLEELNKTLEMSNKEESDKKVNEIEEKIEKFHKSSAYYIEHDELEKIENNFTRCKSLTNTGNFDLAINELKSTIFELKHIPDKYAFNLENIF